MRQGGRHAGMKAAGLAKCTYMLYAILCMVLMCHAIPYAGKEFMTVYHTDSEAGTREVAKKLALRLKKGTFIALNGELGAGKTAFVKGIAEGLCISEDIVSPTYTLLCIYETGELPLYHFDVYRLGGPEGLLDIDFYEYAEGDGVCVCEWASLILTALPEKRINVAISYAGESKRKIEIDEPEE